ncbi:hypothetical protein WCLP8_3810003 [uncultured Gammaproteobacteria bacterium]
MKQELGLVAVGYQVLGPGVFVRKTAACLVDPAVDPRRGGVNFIQVDQRGVVDHVVLESAAQCHQEHQPALGRNGVETGEAVIAWTRTVLNPAHSQFLSNLPLFVQTAGARFVHAEPKSPSMWNYVTEEGQAGESMRAVQDWCVICGHVHVPCVYHIDDHGAAIRFTPRQDIAVRFARTRRWLGVVPSVGQPRDGIPMASYVEWDEGAATYTLRRVAYDVPAAVAKIHAVGLPERLADRLLRGR